MLETFTEINGVTKDECIRAWCIQASIEKWGDVVPRRSAAISALAREFEEFITLGQIDGYRLLSEETIESMDRNARGYGWEVGRGNFVLGAEIVCPVDPENPFVKEN